MYVTCSPAKIIMIIIGAEAAAAADLAAAFPCLSEPPCYISSAIIIY